MWRRSQRGELTPDEARERLDTLRQAPVRTTPIEDDLTVAATLASILGHPVYDCLYLAMAIRENTSVVTADKKFHAIVDNAPAFRGLVRLLG